MQFQPGVKQDIKAFTAAYFLTANKPFHSLPPCLAYMDSAFFTDSFISSSQEIKLDQYPHLLAKQ